MGDPDETVSTWIVAIVPAVNRNEWLIENETLRQAARRTHSEYLPATTARIVLIRCNVVRVSRERTQ